MNRNQERDALHNLADALGEDVAATPGSELLSEVAEDFGNQRVFADEFDKILARTSKASHRQAAAASISTSVWTKFAAWFENVIPTWELAKPMVAGAGVLAVLFLLPLTLHDYNLSGETEISELPNRGTGETQSLEDRLAQDQKLCVASDAAAELRLDACRRQVTSLRKQRDENKLTSEQANWLSTAEVELGKLAR
jgi:hypothetical protein